MDCDICYVNRQSHKFFKLKCCNNQICNDCFDLLLKSTCPFCRSEIPELTHKMSHSLPSYLNNNIPFDFILPFDDIFTESRIYRKYIKRMRKLQQREQDREMNKNLSQAYKNSKSSYKSEINNQIREETLIFHFEEED